MAGYNKVKAITSGNKPNQHKLIRSEYLYLANKALAPTKIEQNKQVFKPSIRPPIIKLKKGKNTSPAVGDAAI